MTETKFFEVRDEGSHIPVMCTRVVVTPSVDDYQMRRAGFPYDRPIYFLTRLTDGETHYWDFQWDLKRGRTMREAHKMIARDWPLLASGDVIDVQFELGETQIKKTSERWNLHAVIPNPDAGEATPSSSPPPASPPSP